MSQSWRPRASALCARMPRTAGAQRRARETRLEAYRRFGRRYEWAVLGLHDDLSYRYPIGPLLGARSAQAELALTGRWNHWDALVASVLVIPAEDTSRPRRNEDVVVQLTMLDTGPAPRQFTATILDDGPHVVPMSAAADEAASRVEALLRDEAGSGALLPHDTLAATEIEIVHARICKPRQRELDVRRPLDLLARLADSLS